MGIPGGIEDGFGDVVREFLIEPDSGKIRRTFIVEPTSPEPIGFTGDGIPRISESALIALVESIKNRKGAAAEPVL